LGGYLTKRRLAAGKAKKEPILSGPALSKYFAGLFSSSSGDSHSLFLDTGAFTAPGTLEVEFCATYATDLMQLDGLDVGGEQGEGPFYTHAVGDLPDRESSGVASSLALDHISLEALDTLLVTFNNFIIDSDIITGFELRELYFSCQLLVYKSYSSVHNFIF
jgi:hypothetical protein